MPWIAAGLSLLLFAASMARDITWRGHGGDGGELITASMTLGIPHPPGYPLYVLIGRLFSLIPLGTVAARYSFLSAVAAAGAIGLVMHIITMRKGSPRISQGMALVLGLALAVTPLVWAQATIAEVYALNMAFVAFFLWTVLNDRGPMLTGLALGLAITSHLTALLLLPVAFISTGRRGLVRLLFGVAMGLAPFLLLPLLSSGNGPVIWGDTSSLRGLWWLASARLYQPNVFGLPWGSWPARFAEWLNPSILLPFMLWLTLAAASAWRARRRESPLPIALLITVLLYLVYAFAYHTEDAEVLLLPGILVAAVLAGRWPATGYNRRYWLLPAAMLLLAVLARPVREEIAVRDTAAAVMSEVPTGAVVLTPGDASIAALWYFHDVEDMRPDVMIVDENMFQFPWHRDRLRTTYPQLQVPTEDDLAQFTAGNQALHPFCRLTLAAAKVAHCSLPGQESSLE